MHCSLWPRLEQITIAVDGGAGDGVAGWGVCVAHPGQTETRDFCGAVALPGHPRHIGATASTNNTAERTALYVGLRYLEFYDVPQATIQYDSSYAAGVCQRKLRVRKNLDLVRRVRLAY